MNLSDTEWLRLEQHVTRRGSAGELADVDRWVAESEELRAIAAGMRTVGTAGAGQGPEWDEAAAWHQVSRRMRWFSRPALETPSRSWRVPLAAAAVLLVGAAAVFAMRPRSQQSTATAIAATAPAREHVTRRGERSAFTLPDGTRIMLGAATRLRIPATYNQAGAGRDVYLDGEGYFEVTHDARRPFRVHTSLGVAEDLGTEFVVSTYPEARGMRVVVAAGIVGVHRGATDSLPLLTLHRGDLARLDSTGTATATRVDPASYLAWTQGELIFRGTPLREVIPRLARWYDLDLRLSTRALENARLTATFRDQSIEQVLNLIALSLDLQVERAGDVVTLHPCGARSCGD